MNDYLTYQLAKAKQADMLDAPATRRPRLRLDFIARFRRNDGSWWIMRPWRHGSPAPGS